MPLSQFDTKFESLPDTLSVFPLSTTLLLPGGQLPLNIVEPRYINMVQDAMASKHRMIGIIQQQENTTHQNKPTLKKIGCAGRITSFEETSDGRFVIVVTGYCRFYCMKEIATIRKYRCFEIEWEKFKHDLILDLNAPINRTELIIQLKSYSNVIKMEMDWGFLDHMPNFNIVTFFAMNLPFNNQEKQDLLEAENLEERADVLIELLKTKIC